MQKQISACCKRGLVKNYFVGLLWSPMFVANLFATNLRPQMGSNQKWDITCFINHLRILLIALLSDTKPRENCTQYFF